MDTRNDWEWSCALSNRCDNTHLNRRNGLRVRTHIANSEKKFEPQMRIKLTTLRVLVWMLLPLSYWKVHQTFRIALGTCSKFSRPPVYKPKTVYLYNWNNVYLFDSKRSYEWCPLLDEHITHKSCQISKFSKIILSKGKWWHWTSKAKLKVDLNFLGESESKLGMEIVPGQSGVEQQLFVLTCLMKCNNCRFTNKKKPLYVHLALLGLRLWWIIVTFGFPTFWTASFFSIAELRVIKKF